MNKITKKWLATFLGSVSLILFSNFIANAQDSNVELPVNRECLVDESLELKLLDATPLNSLNNKINMGNTIDILTKASLDSQEISLEAATSKKLLNPNGFILYLNNYRLNGLYGTPSGQDKLRFKLARADSSQNAWNSILGGSMKFSPRDINISIGCSDGFPIKSSISKKLYLHYWISRIFLVLFSALLFSFLRFFRDSIRDDSPLPSFSYDISKENEIEYKPRSLSSFANLLLGKKYNNKPPFSLGRTQMAWWFFIVTGSFLFIFVRTGDFTNIINSQAIILIGISAGTGLSAVLIDDGKSSVFSEEIKHLKSDITKAKAQPLGLAKEEVEVINKIESKVAKSSNFFKDLLTTKNAVSFHRYQIFVWTIILGILFLIEVINNLSFPEFDPTLLTLQGISAGTYLGFKLPETQKKTKPLQEPTLMEKPQS